MSYEILMNDPETKKLVRQMARDIAWAGPVFHWLIGQARAAFYAARDPVCVSIASDREIELLIVAGNKGRAKRAAR